MVFSDAELSQMLSSERPLDKVISRETTEASLDLLTNSLGRIVLLRTQTDVTTAM